MTELRDDLQAALGATYRLEQELGGGGMSRVFLAEEVALGRKVVIKVLPPEMVSGVNQDRFRREIQLAARLQHPHIVPLLAAGATGDLLWYAMPFIEGESLRVRLARQGDLPVKETVQVLREIADALGYAHSQGVVHRDIKPDNVLVSGRHVLVTDFGVAKAVSDSAGGQSLTSLGMALGTPAYMAPEQASADPHVDHRADIYALGAMGYEMLCGQPPFTGPNPQAVLAAQVMKQPTAVSAARPAVPAALNALVMRCLEKRPSDRWQSAEELGTQLDLLLTPSGGTTPTTAVPAISSGTEAALKRAHPLRVAALFALASVVVLSLVWLAVQRIGLPDWVFYVGIGLMAAGLPIMLLTANRERQRALARSTGTGPSAAGLQRASWNLRYPSSAPVTGAPPPRGGDDEGGFAPSGPLAAPGTYTVQLAKRVDGVLTPLGEPQTFRAEPVGQSTLPPADRKMLLAFQQQTATLQRAVLGSQQVVGQTRTQLQLLRRALDETPTADSVLRQDVRALELRLTDLATELSGDQTIESRSEPGPVSITDRVQNVIGGSWSSTAPTTGTHRRDYEIAAQAFGQWLPKLRQLVDVDLRGLHQKAEAAGVPWTPGRVPEWKP